MRARIAQAALAAALALALGAPSARADFGASSFTAEVQDSGGHLVTQAGLHPYNGITDFQLNTDVTGTMPDGNVKNIRVDLPPGLISNPEATPKCSDAQFMSHSCDAKTQVGEVTIWLSGVPMGPFAVYNMNPQPGQVSDFAFDASGIGLLPRTDIIGGVRPTDYGLFFTISNVPQIPITGSDLTFYGVPANRNGGGGAATPFITLPTFCDGPQTSTLTLESYGGQTATATDTTPTGATGCDQVPFTPSISVTPGTTQQDTPTGVSVALHVPQDQDPTHIATSHVRDAVVTLPAGLTINPPSATGLQACTDVQFAEGTTDAIKCPDASKVGTVSITTPVLAQPLTGNIYIGTPQPDNLFRLFVDAEGQGVIVRLEGRVTPDPNTGQLTTTFAETPQTPFSDFVLTFTGGPNATLANALACGPATTTSSLTPWSGNPAATPSDAYTVDADGNGGACPGTTPFALNFAAGTQNPLAGAFSPFTLTVSRNDGQQYLGKLSVQQPPGLLGMISSVSPCDDAAAAAASCPDASRVGTATVSSGAGPAPFALQGPVYLTGPYKGAPFGLAIVVHALAGPFDLGTVLVRSAIRVDPSDSHLAIDADPLPTILQGVPLRLRTVSVAIDRDQFIFNPTNCSPMAVGATLTSVDGTVQQVSAPFQATGCAGLPFAPKLSTASSARTSKTLGAGLSVTLTQARGESNVKSVSVRLPRQFGARLDTVSLACPVAKFNADPKSCPAGSQVGSARAATPLLHDPLAGGVYLVAPGGGKLPVLEAVLQGSGLTVDLVGTIDLSNGITSTFNAVPDVPITQFALNLPRGVHSVLAVTGDLCAAPLSVPATIVGQSGKTVQQQTPLVIPDCPIKIISAKVKGRKASLTVRVPATGRLTISGKAVETVRRSVRAGRVKIADVLTKKAVRRLAGLRKHHRRLRVPIRARFVPSRGAAAITSKATKRVVFK